MKFHTATQFYSTAFFIVMNPVKYASLVRDAVAVECADVLRSRRHQHSGGGVITTTDDFETSSAVERNCIRNVCYLGRIAALEDAISAAVLASAAAMVLAAQGPGSMGAGAGDRGAWRYSGRS
jgi:hypothetical protein